MTGRRSGWLQVAPAPAVVGVTGAGLALWVAGGQSVVAAVTAAELAVVLGSLGSFICWHRPGDRMGRLVAGTGLGFAAGVLSVGVLSFAAGGGALPDAVVQVALACRWLTVALPAPWALLILWFPDGRFTGRGWRTAFAAAVTVALAVSAAGYLFAPPRQPPGGVFGGATQPLGLTGPLPSAGGAYLTVAGDLLGLLPMLAVVGLIGRYRRGDALVRQQIRWLLLGALGAVAGAAAAAAVGGSASLPGLVIELVTQPMPAAALTVAVLRYRLWEIDLVVSRVTVYAVLWGVLSAVLLLPALAAGLLVGGPGALAAVGLALLVTVAFQPARQRLDRMAQRVAYRHRPRGYALLTHIGRHLRGADDVGAAAVNGIRTGLGVAWAGIWVYVEVGARNVLRPLAVSGADQLSPSAALPPDLVRRLRSASGPVAAPPAELACLWPQPPALVVPLVAGDDLVGLLACGQRLDDPLGEADAQLLDALGRECALALRTRRLEAELRERLEQIEAQSAELRRSRQRLVTAQDEQRRRIESDLHDGVQQQLIALAAGLRRASTVPEGNGTSRLARLACDAEEAVFALQELARGIFPSVLADRGLAAALATQAGRSPLAVHVDVEPTLAGCRLGAETESALYFVALEALANAAKHASTARVTVELQPSPDGSRVLLAVHDDGPGFNPADSAGAGTGLQNMSDRIAAAGGVFFLDSQPGIGTRIRASVPASAESAAVALPAPRLAQVDQYGRHPPVEVGLDRESKLAEDRGDPLLDRAH